MNFSEYLKTRLEGRNIGASVQVSYLDQFALKDLPEFMRYVTRELGMRVGEYVAKEKGNLIVEKRPEQYSRGEATVRVEGYFMSQRDLHDLWQYAQRAQHDRVTSAIDRLAP